MHNSLMKRYEKELKVNMQHVESITTLNVSSFLLIFTLDTNTMTLNAIWYYAHSFTLMVLYSFHLAPWTLALAQEALDVFKFIYFV